MKKVLSILILAFVSYQASSQQTITAPLYKATKDMKPKIGIKAGYNIASIYGETPNFTPKSKNGFTVAGFFAPASKGMGYRTEIVFSRQGFSFDENGHLQNISQDYIYMPHLTTFTIAKRVQLQAGGQIGYLLSAKKTSTENSKEDAVTQYMNRFDYGAAAGIEIYPFKGLIVGGRYNVSMGNMYKHYTESSQTTPMPLPLPVNPQDFKGKNAVINFFVGYRF
jgi:hypothetical protein